MTDIKDVAITIDNVRKYAIANAEQTTINGKQAVIVPIGNEPKVLLDTGNNTAVAVTGYAYTERPLSVATYRNGEQIAHILQDGSLGYHVTYTGDIDAPDTVTLTDKTPCVIWEHGRMVYTDGRADYVQLAINWLDGLDDPTIEDINGITCVYDASRDPLYNDDMCFGGDDFRNWLDVDASGWESYRIGHDWFLKGCYVYYPAVKGMEDCGDWQSEYDTDSPKLFAPRFADFCPMLNAWA